MKAKKSKLKRVNIFKPTINRVYGAAIVVLFMALFVQSLYIVDLKRTQEMQGTFQMRSLIISAIDGLYDLGKEQVAINYDKNQVTVPAAKILLPLDTEQHSGLSALYTPGFDNSSDAITFSEGKTRSAANSLESGSMESLFEGVPMVQACSRQVLVEFTDAESTEYASDYQKVFSKTLKDGRQVTGFKSTLCTQGADELAAYIGKLQSY